VNQSTRSGISTRQRRTAGKVEKSFVRVLCLLAVVMGVQSGSAAEGDATTGIQMPRRGICAHRGASDTHPENTLAAFREAIRLGAHMIEFDVALSKDGQLVLMHDTTVDRTTDGSGPVSGLTLEELKKLDAGSWKNNRFKGERIPTLDEALAIMPDNMWLNVHLKGGAKLAEEVTKQIVAAERLHQSFLACGEAAAVAAKQIDKRIQICNMERQANSLRYVNETIAMRADFIQLYGGKSVNAAHTKRLREHGIRINFCCANGAAVVDALFKAGTEFPLVDQLAAMLKVADRNGIARLKPVYRPRVTHGPMLGHIGANDILIWARFSESGKYQLTVRDSQGNSPPGVSAHAKQESDNCVRWKIEGLRAGTRYQYEIAAEGQTLVDGEDCWFETASAASSTNVRFAFGSCAREDEGSAAVWRRMRQLDPHAVVLLGDTPYIDSTELDVQRRRHREFAAVQDFRRLVRNRSLYATWDDHDFGRNDTNGILPGKANSRRAFAEYHANPSYGDGKQGIYTRFRRGCVEVFLLDTRFFAATETSPFDETRPSLLGKTQWQWLQRGLKASTAPFKVLACGMIWNKAVRPGKQDHWGTYPHERDALFEFIGREKIAGVVLIGGDIHRTRVLRHHSTEQAGYRIPELITSPVHDGVIANAKQPHPALIHDSGEPNSFLLLTVDNRATPCTLTASFQNSAGREFYRLKLTDRDLK
jgi:alkaline phosphatase D